MFFSYVNSDRITGKEMWFVLQLDKPSRLLNLRIATVEEQNDENCRIKIPLTEHRVATEADRQGLEDNVSIKKTGNFVLIEGNPVTMLKINRI